jgi:hypothetical protein
MLELRGSERRLGAIPSRLCLVIDVRGRVVGLVSLSLLSQVAVDVEVAEGGVEFRLEAGAFFAEGFAVFG